MTLRNDHVRRSPLTRRGWLPLICLLLASAVHAEDPESIQDFVDRRGQWNALVGAKFTLEGRVGIIARNRLMFDHCELEFRLPSTLPALPRGARVAQVSGVMARQDGKLYFDVSEIKSLASDQQTLLARRSRIDSSKSQEWFNLADWAERRGKFYQDPELIGKALELREIAFMAEYRRLRPDDVTGLLALAKRAAAAGLSESVSWRCIHDACRIQLAQIRKQERPDESVVLDAILKQLPGAKDPLAPEDESLRASYRAKPNEFYAQADAAVRKKLHRVLYVDTLLARIERDAQPDGANGEIIAQRIQQQLPEMKTLADQYREKGIEYLTSRIVSLSRDELQRLVANFESQGRTDDVTRVRREWLKGQERTRRAAGASGLVDLGNDYMLQLKDERTAAELFQEAYRANPQMPEPVEWLKGHGYVLHEDRWYPADLAPRSETERFADAIREGRVVKGMSESQARAAMGARPSSVLRNAARSKVSELWVYKSQGLVISLVKGPGQSEPKVDSVISIDR